MTTAVQPVAGPPAGRERLFYSGMALAVFAAVFYGFYHSYFLYPLYPDWHVPPERFFWLHGTLMVAWFTLMVVQPLLIAIAETGAWLAMAQALTGLVR